MEVIIISKSTITMKVISSESTITMEVIISRSTIYLTMWVYVIICEATIPMEISESSIPKK